MKIEELSIGDWVLCEGEYWKISAVNEDSVGLRADSDYSVASLEECDPIPLTPEILKKNGFEIYHKGIEFDYYDTNLENGKSLLLSFDRGKNFYLMYEEKGERGMHQIDCPLGSVHQLQHALRLAGIEKEIELK